MKEWMIKSSCCMLPILILYLGVLRREKMFVVNRFLLLFGVVFSLLCPFIPIGEEELPTLEMMFQNTDASISVRAFHVQNFSEPNKFLWYGLGAVSLFFFVRFVVYLYAIYRKIRKGEKVVRANSVLVLQDEDSLPFAFGNYIFVNKESYRNQEIAPELLTHEMAHVAQKHSWDVLFVEFCLIFLWWQPLLWAFRKVIRLNHEFLADEAVLKSSADISSYQKYATRFDCYKKNSWLHQSF